MKSYSNEQKAALYELHKRRLRADPEYWAAHALRYYGDNFEMSACHRLLVQRLRQVAAGEITKLMIFMPSGCAKTLHTSRIFPAWCLATMPGINIIAASHNADFAENKVSAPVQNLMTHFADELGAKPINENKKEWECSNGSTYRAAGVGAGILGERCDLGIIDDPFGSFEDAMSETIRNKTYDWYRNTFVSRLKPGARVVLMHQRVHIDDLAGRLLEEEGDDWTVLYLPAVWDQTSWTGEFMETDELGRKPGDSVWPEYFTDDFLTQKEKDVSPIGWSSMYQQRPTPVGGSLFKPDLIGRIAAAPSEPLKVIRAWDIASTAPKGSNDPDWTVGVKMQKNRNGTFTILDIVRLQGGPEDVRASILNTASDDGPDVYISLPQDPGAAGKYVVSDLTKGLAGYRVTASPESGDKFTRAMPFAAQVNAGNVNIVEGHYFRAFKDELALFPASKKDDQVDACSRAFANLIDLGLIARRPTFSTSRHMSR